MPNTLTIGERVAWYRRRRGLSQEVLAGLVGRTADWLGKIENNRIEMDRLSVIKSLADVLDSHSATSSPNRPCSTGPPTAAPTPCPPYAPP
ncbi:helix-turn-helix transcriptional regulator [Plantactinospora sp. B6F1]|uniref:helix-turn-helix domain-containing protein n=1 Tax=Plantactinospora sp. B6F1 TaxID=3158971 RepID=UPI0032D92E24